MLTSGMNRGAGHRRDDTTLILLEAAADELIQVGQADFTMEGLARRGFFSVGAVYDRWKDREQCIADVAQTVAQTRLETFLDASKSLPGFIGTALENSDKTLTLLGEIFIAAQYMPAVQEPAHNLWVQAERRFRRWMGPGMSWYMASVCIGGALIDLMDVDRPSERGMDFFVAACRAEADPKSGPSLGGVTIEQVSIPQVPGPSRTDDVASSLIDAARVVLAERGASAAGARDIATVAGVTTGALYRRYEGKSRLLADVLVAQLEPDRYEWTWDLIRAFATEDPYDRAADVLAQRIVATGNDRAGQQVLLQIGVAARNEPALRSQVHQRISVAIDARREMIDHFKVVGLLREDLDAAVPAWAFQALPVGMRATLAVTDVSDADRAEAAMRALLVSVSAK